MAYEVNQDDQPQQVAGSSPLSQGGAAPAAQPQGGVQPSGQPSTPARIQEGASVNQAASQGAAQNKKSGSASSGMFTNVQKYVERNRPQAQKMAKAVTQDFSKQAGEIAQQAKEKREQQRAQLDTNIGTMQTQYAQGADIIGSIMEGGYTPQTSSVFTPQQQTEVDPMEDMRQQFEAGGGGDEAAWQQYQDKKLKEMLKGPQIERLGELNLSQQNLRAQALANLAQGSDREQFRKGLMRQTFGDRGYTRGQSALDDLILGGSKAAREQIIGGTKGAADTLTKALAGVQEASRKQVGEQDILADQFSEELKGIAQQAAQKVYGGEDSYAAADTAKAIAEREKLLNQYVSDIKSQFGSKVADEFYRNIRKDNGWTVTETKPQSRDFEQITGEIDDKMLGNLMGWDSYSSSYSGYIPKKQVDKAYSNLEKKLRDASSVQGYTAIDIPKVMSQIKKYVGKAPNQGGSYFAEKLEDAISKYYENPLRKGQYDVDPFIQSKIKDIDLSGKEFSERDFVSQENIDRYNRLMGLLGSGEAPLTASQYYMPGEEGLAKYRDTTSTALQNLINKYGK